MLNEQLTPDGIDLMLKGQLVNLQIYNIERIQAKNQNSTIMLIKATVSDGFAYFKSVYLFNQYFLHDNIQMNVVKLKITDGLKKKIARGYKQFAIPLVTDPKQFCIITNKIDYMIGKPIQYQKYVSNGKKNPNGSRKIFQGEKQVDDTDDDLFQQAMNARNILQQKKIQKKQIQKPKNQPKRQLSQNPRQNSNSRNNSLSHTNQYTNQQKPKPKQNSNPDSNSNPKPPSKPIIKNQHPQHKRTSIKPQVKHHEGDHEKIINLFLGIQNFKIVARLLFIWPIKTIINKKGNQSQLLNMQFGDQTGKIMCTVFGDQANKYSTLIVDNIYGITGATITQTTYKGQTQLKLNLNDSTRIDIQKNYNNKNFPTIQKFCLSLRQLSTQQKGKSVSVICMVKQCQLVQFVSKNGNNIKRKMLKLFDLDNQLECDLTLFNQKAQIKYQPGMYALKGVQVDQFQGNKQYKGSLIFIARYLKNHPLNGKSIQQLQFSNITSNHKPKRQLVSSFYILNQKCQQLNVGQNIWSEIICYLKTIRLGGNSKNVYLSCPHCKKKILQQDATYCQQCKKQFERPKYRYILNVNLIDDHDNIWIGAYDDIGQILLALPSEKLFSADIFAEMSEQQLRQRLQQIRYKQIKAKIVSTKEQYNNQVRVKHKIVRLLPINYNEEIKMLMEKIKGATIV